LKSALTLLLLSTFTAAHAPAGQETNLLVTSCFCSGANYFYEIPMSKASALPQWNPESGATAPLSISSACALAKKALAARVPQLKQMEVRHIELWPVAKTGSWYYRIEGQGVMFDRYESPCGLMAVILMDGSNVEPRVTETPSDLAEALKQASTNSFDYAGRMAQAFSGSTNALAQVLGFSRNIDPARAPGHGALLIEALGMLGDETFAKVAAAQAPDTKAAVLAHLTTGATHTKIAKLQRPIAIAFPLTYEALTTSNPPL
jgi:hypothetical protein